MSKYKTGDRFIIEIDKHMTNKDGNLYGIKGYRTLVMDENGLSRLERYTERDCDSCADEWLAREKVVQDIGYSAGKDKGYKDGYEAGCREVWGAMRTLLYPSPEGISISKMQEFFGECTVQQILKKYEVCDVLSILKEHEEKQKQPDESIKVGDEVTTDGEDKYLITSEKSDQELYWAIGTNGESYAFRDEHIKRTGRTFPIQNLLDMIRIQPHDPEQDGDSIPCPDCKYYDGEEDEFPCCDCQYTDGASRSYFTKETE